MRDAEIAKLEQCNGRQLMQLLALASTAGTSVLDRLFAIGDAQQLEEALAGILVDAPPGPNWLLAICSPDTPLDDLIACKTAAKHLTVAADTPDRQAAATLLYHLAVASALAHHARNISTHDPASRLSLYRELAAGIYDDVLADIFKRAAARISSAST